MGPATEQCDCLDNDCDSVTDEDADCGSGVCRAEFCRCVEPCAAGEFPCPPGFLAVESAGECFCEPDLCLGVVCAEGESCQVVMGAATCVSLCEGVECAAHEICKNGVCQDDSCETQGCPKGEQCVDRECVPDACAAVDCDAGELCAGGRCCPSRCEPSCGDGTRCRVADCLAQCEPDACAGVSCPQFQVCMEGECVPDPCAGITCAQGQACCGGTCVADPCRSIRCDEDEVCDPAAMCRQDEPCRPEFKLLGDPLRAAASGAGGCACEVGARDRDESPAWWLLAILALRRRR